LAYRAGFARQLYNLRHVHEEIDDTDAKIQQLQNRIDQHDEEYPMKSFHPRIPGGTRGNVLTVMPMIEA
jgi:hypothetical protein